MYVDSFCEGQTRRARDRQIPIPTTVSHFGAIFFPVAHGTVVVCKNNTRVLGRRGQACAGEKRKRNFTAPPPQSLTRLRYFIYHTEMKTRLINASPPSAPPPRP